MDEHKTQQPEPEIVPARRKSGRMRSWKASILACVICILVTALVTSLIFVGKFGGSRNYKLALKFAQVKQVVDKNYIGDADDTAISDAASSAIISAIGDKWSYYMTAEEYKAYQMYSNNEYAGIGVTIQLDDKTKGFRITAVTSDSPAANARPQAGRHHHGNRRRGRHGQDPLGGADHYPRQAQQDAQAYRAGYGRQEPDGHAGLYGYLYRPRDL